jgi:hypothetical protein
MQIANVQKVRARLSDRLIEDGLDDGLLRNLYCGGEARYWIAFGVRHYASMEVPGHLPLLASLDI